MTARLTLVAPAVSGGLRAAVFGADGPLDATGRRAAERARAAGTPRADRAWTAPAAHCRETAGALRLRAEGRAELADWDAGAWRGRPLAEVAAERPREVEAWLTDPEAAPHGGESLAALLARTGEWLGSVPQGRTVAVADPALVRAALVRALGLPPAAFWRLDVAPLAATELVGRGGRWNLRVGAVLGGWARGRCSGAGRLVVLLCADRRNATGGS
ncbi:histidine phosphatase family protein [Streptomyces polyrhachis]|uniref:Histidine phosphatase family protein n=1 Tax=Streptomyces polyrhachis TaxID=1282885 RepID=A0ABW2GG66_9ACTN